MGKNIQISEELFCRLCSYFILDKRDALNEAIITNELEAKFSRVQARTDYAAALATKKQGR